MDGSQFSSPCTKTTPLDGVGTEISNNGFCIRTAKKNFLDDIKFVANILPPQKFSKGNEEYLVSLFIEILSYTINKPFSGGNI
jgi:hypothetical protein